MKCMGFQILCDNENSYKHFLIALLYYDFLRQEKISQLEK